LRCLQTLLLLLLLLVPRPSRVQQMHVQLWRVVMHLQLLVQAWPQRTQLQQQQQLRGGPHRASAVVQVMSSLRLQLSMASRHQQQNLLLLLLMLLVLHWSLLMHLHSSSSSSSRQRMQAILSLWRPLQLHQQSRSPPNQQQQQQHSL
jgi:hypothetical protein